MSAEFCLILGIMGVASIPSPYYAALSLVVGAGAGCYMMIKGGAIFLSLVLFLIYLGGMMVVFGYCVALVAEPYPESWGGLGVCVCLGVYGVLLSLGYAWGGGFSKLVYSFKDHEMVGFNDLWGVTNLYSGGALFLLAGGWSLLLCLFVVLEVVAGRKFGALKAV
uniref:NADH dehydrogenase subunit 6 n=1 Tax=Ptychadena anchietae TaxID=127654 RepID=UPI00286A034F|nr:NADH dehydrogenase subunit 6 [Ptychadena anchietae]WKT09024.1 NADH dehydrogenase subunit 6 [Ptychadena anchietae]